jgi:UDP-2,3-diacylglucosamine pyrophosphatase LpxH
MALHYRSVWISDTHLGTKGCKALELRDFLDHLECDTLYLVGDIIDLWKFKSGFYWPSAHSAVVQQVFDMAKRGTRVIYIPGNHDESFRKHAGMHFNGIDVQLNAIHQTVDGRKFLVLHGDEFDSIVCHNKNLAYIGSEAYEGLLVVNRWFNALRIRMGYKYWSLSAYIKHKVKNIVSFMDNYQHILSLEAQKRKVDGVICGHIHHANLSEMELGKTYGNCGDWVESCTALVEDFAGQISLVRWLEQRQSLLDAQLDERPDYAKAA